MVVDIQEAKASLTLRLEEGVPKAKWAGREVMAGVVKVVGGSNGSKLPKIFRDPSESVKLTDIEPGHVEFYCLEQGLQQVTLMCR
jgi:hypothetical protein